MGAARKRCERAGHLKKIKIKLETVRGERERERKMGRCCGRGRERGNETLMETDGRPGCRETERRDANMMSSSPC